MARCSHSLSGCPVWLYLCGSDHDGPVRCIAVRIGGLRRRGSRLLLLGGPMSIYAKLMGFLGWLVG